MPEQKPLSRKTLLYIGVVIVIIVVAVIALYFLMTKRVRPEENSQNQSGQTTLTKSSASETLKRLGGSENCEGSGPVELTHLPMDENDFGVVLPYGLMVGAHVTPIDHWYFSPASRNSKRDQYPVYAMADGVISEISTRGINVDTGEARDIEYRLVFTHTCTFLTYYDLVTSLDQTILDQASDLKNSSHSRVDIPVKAGQQIGRIGAQTLDFAVWDLTKTLSGFANLESYSQADPWKPYTADPYNYVAASIKQILVDRNPRTEEPLAGKIDYDVKGKIVGNWFREGTNGYAGINQSQYWRDHLAIVYNYLDPSAIEISIGDWKGDEAQFAVVGNAPDPGTVGVSSEPTKFELVKFGYADSTGKNWDNTSVVKGLKVAPFSGVEGTILVQLIEDGKLKIETFPGKKASQVTGFTDNAKIFVH